jgi:DNA/RNA endonuclease YhcR with UshA esterase domain
MSVGTKCLISRSVGARLFLKGAISLVVCLGTGTCQDQQRSNNAPLKYDLQAETKIKGDVEEVKLFALGTRKDFVELVVKSGDAKVEVYVCPKPFQDEMAITLSKGDAITITGAKAKHEEADVILAREVVRGQDTFMLRDNKGNPIWDSRTGK